MVNVSEALEEAGAKSKMLQHVHDELVFDFARDEQKSVVPLMVKSMQKTVPMQVPIVVDTRVGENWLEAN